MNYIQIEQVDGWVDMIDLTERQPCWYANLEDLNNKSKAKWIVGVKDCDGTREYKFRLVRICDPQDEKKWAEMSSLKTALRLIELFRSGEERAILSWLKEFKE